jgi:hypothetical protein
MSDPVTASPEVLEKLRAKIASEDDVKKVVRLEPLNNGRFRYLIETPFKTFPQGVIGTTDSEFDDVRIELRASSLRAAEESWDRVVNKLPLE